MQRTGRLVGRAAASVCNVLDLDLVVIGGAVALGFGATFFNAAQETVDELAKVGSIMGSGGMIVMDQDTCMVDLARYFVEFLKDESCGQCKPCREGRGWMWRVLERMAKGQAEKREIDMLLNVS